MSRARTSRPGGRDGGTGARRGTARWDALASSYRRQLWLERRPLRRLLDLVAVAPKDELLDVATGTAALLEELARRPGRPTTAVGIDSSRAMLALAPSLPEDWRLEQADATAMPYPDASFDVVTVCYLLHVLQPAPRRAAIAEIARLVRPGGRVGTLTIAPPRGPLARLLSAPVRAAAERSIGRLQGLSPLDPGAALAAAGLRETARARTLAGYPSLCLVATKSAQLGGV